MYAVIKTGGKQYKVENEQKILVDRINADEGSIVTLSDLLMVVDSGKISQGKDLQNMAVSATVVKQTRGPKIITLKHRRRKNSRRVKGHKQDLTLLKVVGIGDPKKLVIKDQKDQKKAINKKVESKSKVTTSKSSEEKQIIKKSVTTKKTDSKAVKKTSTTKKDDKVKSTATKTSTKKK